MPKIRGVLCDLDGTLVNTEVLQLRAWEEIIRQHDHELPVGWENQYIGNPDSQMAEYCHTLFPDLPVPEALLFKRHVHYRKILESVGEGICFRGVRAGLTALQEIGLPMAIGTNSPRENVSVVLHLARIEGFFQAVISFGMTKNGKPSPDIFLAGAEKLKLNPKECVVVEDTASGIRAGLAAGCRVIAVTTTHDESILHQAEQVFKTTSSALQWIAEMAEGHSIH